MSDTPQVEKKKITDFTQDASNANLGTERGLRALDDSLAKVGLGRSIVVDKHGNIIAGNKTQERAVDSGFEDAIVVKTDGTQMVVVQREDLDLMDISPENKARLLAYYDNRVGQLDLQWNTVQLFADKQAGLDLNPLFSEQEQVDLFAGIEGNIGNDDGLYTRKVEPPIYEPSREKPQISDLYDDERTSQLIADINASDLPQDEKEFLIVAAQRHTVLNFSKIADYYAHSGPTVQKLMEDSALVIIDFDRAIELGFVKLTHQIAELEREEYG